MEEDELLFDKIEAYLRRKLPDDEATAFERDIAADPDLQELVEIHRFEHEGIRQLVEDDLRQKIRGWTLDTPPPAEPGSGGDLHWKRWGIAAGFVIFGLALWIFFPLKNDPPVPVTPPVEEPAAPVASVIEPVKTEQPATPTSPARSTPEQPKTKQPEPAVPKTIEPTVASVEVRVRLLADTGFTSTEAVQKRSTRGSSPPGNDISSFAQAERAFYASSPDYGAAILSLKKISSGDTRFEEASELLGRAYFHSNQYAEAAKAFQSILEPGYSKQTRDRGEWYLLLSLLHDYPMGTDRTTELFRSMLSPKHRYHDDAVRLTTEIERVYGSKK